MKCEDFLNYISIESFVLFNMKLFVFIFNIKSLKPFIFNILLLRNNDKSET